MHALMPVKLRLLCMDMAIRGSRTSMSRERSSSIGNPRTCKDTKQSNAQGSLTPTKANGRSGSIPMRVSPLEREIVLGQVFAMNGHLFVDRSPTQHTDSKVVRKHDSVLERDDESCEIGQ